MRGIIDQITVDHGNDEDIQLICHEQLSFIRQRTPLDLFMYQCDNEKFTILPHILASINDELYIAE